MAPTFLQKECRVAGFLPGFGFMGISQDPGVHGNDHPIFLTGQGPHPCFIRGIGGEALLEVDDLVIRLH